ncbi:unannotated protein [freshwater metagenome]|uniref:Unannotated protein n=1 Tax=freshwater metagenome TaxID=449393 RepID=A0A6J7FH25_9ZZZZ
MTNDSSGEPTVMPPMGSEMICTPCHVTSAATKSCAASLMVQSRSQISSATPTMTMRRAAPRMAMICVGSVNTTRKKEMRLAIANATMRPANIAMPPKRGVGRTCTSRSRILGYSRYLRLTLRITHDRQNETQAATSTMSASISMASYSPMSYRVPTPHPVPCAGRRATRHPCEQCERPMCRARCPSHRR